MIKKHYWLIAIMVLMIFGSCSLRDQIVQPINDSIFSVEMLHRINKCVDSILAADSLASNRSEGLE